MLVHMYSLTLALSLFSLLCAFSPVSALPTRTTNGKSARWSSDFVKRSGAKFTLNDKEYRYVGTTAVWLPALNSDDDIRNTFANMSQVGIKVVRVYGFNDVTEIPEAGVWLTLIKDKTVTFNEGLNGFPRLDKVVELAKKYDIRLLIPLTNNWSLPPNSSDLPRNFLANDYGGMDTYVREFCPNGTHDKFYTDMTIREKFYSSLEFVVKRYANEPTVLGWEVANDPRCESTIPTSDQCDSNIITQWIAATAQKIRSLDANHPIGSGAHGFLCPSCPKLFAKPPPPQPSPAPDGSRKRTVGGLLTPSKFFRMITEGRRAAPRASGVREGLNIRGRWTAPLSAKRHNSGVGPAFNGGHGVDSEDISSIPHIDFHTFQLFADQNDYELTGSQSQSPATDFNRTLQTTTDWIAQQLNVAKTIGKPAVLTSIGFVTQDNLRLFIPFNSSTPLAQSPQKLWNRQDAPGISVGVNEQQNTAGLSSLIGATFTGGGSGVNQFQWVSQNVLSAPGTVVQSSSPGSTVGQTPNGGYGGDSSVQQVLNTASQNIM